MKMIIWLYPTSGFGTPFSLQVNPTFGRKTMFKVIGLLMFVNAEVYTDFQDAGK